MTIEEQRLEVEHFIRNLESVQYYNRKLISINLELEGVAAILYEASSIRYDGVIGQRNPYQNRILSLITKEEELIDYALKYERLITKLSNILNLCSPDVKKALIHKFVLKNNWEDTAILVNYSRKGITNNIDKELSEVLRVANATDKLW